jgi:hypothetical protein
MSHNLQVRHGLLVTITDDRKVYAEMRAVGSVSDILTLAHKFAAAEEMAEALEMLLQAEPYRAGREDSYAELLRNGRRALDKSQGYL